VRGPIAERRDVTTDSRDRRPAPTAIGAAFVFVRGLLALYLAISLLASPDAFASDLAVVPAGAERTVAFWVVAAVLMVFAAAELGVAWAVLLGRNWARLTAMTLSTAAILAQAANVVQGGPGITLQTNLPGLAVDILLLLALSSERALVYARRERKAPKRIAARPGSVARL
jgi:hypothetical protein